jgi:hypothetical protein
MVHVTFFLDGRETIVTDHAGQHPPHSVDRVMLLVTKKHIHRRLGDLQCAQHGESPHVIANGPSAERLQFSVEGCCDALVMAATRALGTTPV